jgi:hypothetical protein
MRLYVMTVGYINDIFNNTSRQCWIRSVDSQHNGHLTASNGESFKLDDGNFHGLSAKTHYSAAWCGIPWDANGSHYKVFSYDGNHHLAFSAKEFDGYNYILYKVGGQMVARQAAPDHAMAEFHCRMMIEDNSFQIAVVNWNSLGNARSSFEIYNGSWVTIGEEQFGRELAARAGV